MNDLLLVDRGVHVYQGLLTELHNDPDIGAIHACETAQDALERSEQSTYAAVLINAATLSQREALSLTREVNRRRPPVQVLVFGLANATERVLEFIEAGADGYVRGAQPVQAIGRSLRRMLRGEAVLCPDVAAGLLSRIARLSGFRSAPANGNGRAELSPRQREVLQMLEHGLSNAEIAERLSIEVGTVKNHVHNVLKNLNVRNRQEAAKLASTLLTSNGQVYD